MSDLPRADRDSPDPDESSAEVDRNTLLAFLMASADGYYSSSLSPRAAAAWQLSALIKMAEKMFPEEHRKLLGPARRLYAALHNVDDGKHDPLLLPPKIGHRPQLAANLQIFRAHAAAAMDLYMKAFEPPPRLRALLPTKRMAAKIVAAQLSLPGQKAFTPQTIAKWRDEVMLGGEKIGAVTYRNIMRASSKKFPNDPQRAATDLIRGLLFDLILQARERNTE